jgi:GNAT superfamily N-acetyltransferase
VVSRPSFGPYRIIPMPADALARHASLHREGFETRASSPGIDQRLIKINLKAGVEYLWAIHEPGGSPVGSVAILAAGNTAELFALSVVPAHRRRGVGSGLVQAALDRAAQSGASLVYLQSEPGSQAAALYESLGFILLWHQVSYVLP